MTDVRFRYAGGEFELHVESLTIAPGSRTAVVGPSGSGKTTLLHLVAGVYVPESGSISVGDVRVDRLSDAARRDFRIRTIGFVFQDFELLDYLSVRENVLLPYFVNPVLSVNADVRSRADALLERMGLGDKLGRRIDRLSQGERQRVAISRALLPEPTVILADEPTGNLDPENSRRIADLLLETATETGATLLCVTHDHGLLDGFDHVVDFAEFRRATTP